MAATNSTSNLGLPQWEATDKPERTDFNTAMSEIDNTVTSHLAESATQTDLGHIKLRESWKDATLQNGWSGSLQYAKNDIGQLMIKGSLTVGTITANTIISTLPSGYHTTYRGIIMAQETESGNGYPTLYINNTGGYIRVTANPGVVAGRTCNFFAIFDIA